MFLAIAIAVLAPLLASAADLRIPPQALGPSLQELARQSGIQIIFFTKLVEGHDAPALNGTFTPEAALAVLLDGTDLTYHVLNENAIEVAARPVAAAPPPAKPVPDAPLDEVEINAQHAKLSVMRAEIEKLEDQFYAAYNKLNTDHQYDVACRMETRKNSHVVTRVCEAEFVTRAAADEASGFFIGHLAPPAELVILLKTPDYQKNMVDMVKQHPELFKLVKERNALEQRYAAVRKQKFKAKSFVWD